MALQTNRSKLVSDKCKLDVRDMIGHKLQLLGARATDPAHPWHNLLEWDAETGLPVLPDDRALALLVISALSEPEPS